MEIVQREAVSVTSSEPRAGLDDPTRWSADDALTALYRAHWRSLVRLAYLLVRDQSAAEDVAQDAFISMHRRWRRLDRPDQALAYLRTSVVNGSRTAHRRRAVRERWTASGGPTRLDPAPRGDTAAEPSAEDVVVARDERCAVTQTLLGLPQRQREVLVLRYHLDLSEQQIASTLQISPGAVKSHAHRGLAALRRALAADASFVHPSAPPDEEPQP
jgi:RNA polymerase sigma-70 factor (sigma-E family)